MEREKRGDTMFCIRNCDGHRRCHHTSECSHLRNSFAPPSFRHLLNLQIASVSLPSKTRQRLRPIPRGGICTEKATHYGVPEGHPTMVQMCQTLRKRREKAARNAQNLTKCRETSKKCKKTLRTCMENCKKGKQLRKCMEKLQKVQNKRKKCKKSART